MAVDALRARMAEDYRRSGNVQRIVHARRADVAEIDQHAQPLHFAHHAGTECSQPVVRGIVGGAVGPGSVPEVGQRHVARPERVHLPQHR
jgi:hypothetical protein